MIVNTAYIYMGGGAAVNPNLFQDGVSNYPVVFTSSASISSDGVYLPYNYSSATFSELPLTDFNSLILSVTIKGAAGNIIPIEFYDASGSSIETVSAEFKGSGGTSTVNIPGAAKIENAKIKITNRSSIATITIRSALLS